MRNMNKIFVAVIAIILVFSVVGCGPAKSTVATIHILTQDQAGMKPAEIDQIARDFEALNPDIKVVMEYVGYDAIHDKVVTGMAATPPAYDASMVDVIWPDEFIKRIPAGCNQPDYSRNEIRDIPGLLEWRHPQWQDLWHAMAHGC